MNIVLGVTAHFHDSSATLVKDGVVIAAAEEERFSRIKHDNSFPIESIKYCLKEAEILGEEITHVAYFEKPVLKFERVLTQHIENYPKSSKSFIGGIPSWFKDKFSVRGKLKKLKINAPVLYIPHHMSHAASAFLPSPFRKSAIVTLDGVGEWTTTAIGNGKGSEISLLKQIKFPHSIGLLYSTITAYLGFTVNNAEYKVMGLSAYGETDKNKNKYYKQLKKVVDIKEDGSFRLDQSYFKYTYTTRMPSEKLETLLGGKTLKSSKDIKQRHKDIAAAVQLITEEIVFKILNYTHSITNQDNLVMAGGVALNSLMNGKILSNTGFKNVWIQPNSTDGGTSMGAALFVSNSLLGDERTYKLKNSFLGPKFDSHYIKNFLDQENIKYSEFSDSRDLVKVTAKLLKEENVIGWFQGRMEWGPRALGARSILASPLKSEMQDIINLKVKKRESFRPFAPVVAYDDAIKYFETDEPIPDSADFMLLVYPIKKKYHSKIPAVRHIDGTGRLQTIKRKQMPLYYDVIKEFGKLTGIPILINTSFNIRGEPIICTPEDAYRCMMGTEIDYLVMGKFLIKRDDNPDHVWNSEVSKLD